MTAYYIACRNFGEFAKKLLNGVYDRHIHRDLCDIAEVEGYQSFKDADPTGFFDFTIELKDEGDFFHIDPWDKDHFRQFNRDVSEFERKVNILLTAVIHEKYEDLLKSLKLHSRKSANTYSVQILNDPGCESSIVQMSK
ncbi:MAG TPA: hypothetical protein GX017_03315 [Clostridiales bacterium]|jgi:hypothetical protein|nr:hypothetical protein [Clostridiales bacterium]